MVARRTASIGSISLRMCVRHRSSSPPYSRFSTRMSNALPLYATITFAASIHASSSDTGRAPRPSGVRSTRVCQNVSVVAASFIVAAVAPWASHIAHATDTSNAVQIDKYVQPAEEGTGYEVTGDIAEI